jgi:RNA polymerase sigma-70 factor (ECF subfamily)
MCQERFFEQYQPLLYVFFKRKGLQDQDAEDLASELVLKLLKRMGNFKYDHSRSFRSYLNTAAQRAVNELREALGKRRELKDDDLAHLFAPGGLEERLGEQFDLDLRKEAMRRVQGDVSERDWQIFVDLTEATATPDELAAKYGVGRGVVDTAKWRVKNRIATEVRKLELQGFDEA